MVKDPDTRFLYRDSLWHGADMLGLGVASFSHLGGVHSQNQHHLDPYLEAVERGDAAAFRAAHDLPDDGRLVLVVGGSQGAAALTDAARAAVRAYDQRVAVINVSASAD